MNMSFYTGAVGAKQFTKKLSVTANNLANVNTRGYKPKTASFSNLIEYNLNDGENAVTELQAGAGAALTRTWTDFSASGVTQTGGEHDYAILDSNSFFMLQDPQTGEITYTRDGHFHKGEYEDGFYLTSANGKLVLDQNQEPLELEVTDVEKIQQEMEEGVDDTEDVDDTDDSEDEDKPRIGIYTFANPSRLISRGDNEFIPMDAGAEATENGNASLAQGSLEASGTDVAKEMTRVIECQRAFSYALKMVTTSDEIESTINSLRG